MVKQITAATTDAKYLASDSDMLAAEKLYQAYEHELEQQVANIECAYPGYHNYIYDIATIGHDPYVLISIISAIKPDFTIDDPAVTDLFATLRQPRRQYTLTITKVPANADDALSPAGIDAMNPELLDLHVKLTNYDLYCVVDSILTHDQLAAYAGYIRNQGERPDLFPISDYPHAVPYQAPLEHHVDNKTLANYPRLAHMLTIGEQYIGYPYVWGGGEPDTSFDCSGYIDYIMDQLGYNYRNNIDGVERRLPVAGSTIKGTFYDGIYEKCQPIDQNSAEPGDLIFFAGTFDANYRAVNLSHVGIYVGDNTFLACSAPHGVGYQTFAMTDDKGRSWGELVYGYGRLPEPGEQK